MRPLALCVGGIQLGDEGVGGNDPVDRRNCATRDGEGKCGGGNGVQAGLIGIRDREIAGRQVSGAVSAFAAVEHICGSAEINDARGIDSDAAAYGDGAVVSAEVS